MMPEIQLELFEEYQMELLSQSQNTGIIKGLDENFINMHIEVLCKNPARHEDIIDKFNFYQKYSIKTLNICAKYNARKAQAFLEEKLNGLKGIFNSIRIKFDIFEQGLREFISSIGEISIQHHEELKERLRDVLDIICHYKEYDEIKQMIKFLFEAMAKLRSGIEGIFDEQEKKNSFHKTFDKLYSDPPILQILAENFEGDAFKVDCEL